MSQRTATAMLALLVLILTLGPIRVGAQRPRTTKLSGAPRLRCSLRIPSSHAR